MRLIRVDGLEELLNNPNNGACPSTGHLNKLRHTNIKLLFNNGDSMLPIKLLEKQEENKAVKVCAVAVEVVVAVEVALPAVVVVVMAVKQVVEAVDPWAA